MKRLSIGLLAALLMIGAIAYFNVTIFVVQPIGAIPEGRTLIIRRMGQLGFIDSADGICQREMGGVSLLCRGSVLAKIVNNGTIYVRLPYSHTLYLVSTGGVEFEK